MVAQVKRRREVWSDNVMENEGSLVNRVMNGHVAGKRPRGRPRKRWKGDSRIASLSFYCLYSMWIIHL